jgi:hypothetical protein
MMFVVLAFNSRAKHDAPSKNGVSIGALKLLPDRLTSSRRLEALSPAIEGSLDSRQSHPACIGSYIFL